MDPQKCAKTALYYHPLFLEHKTAGHPECPERLTAMLDHLDNRGILSEMELVTPREAAVEEIARIHSIDYIQSIADVSAAGGGDVDADTFVAPATFDAALLAAGASVDAARDVLSGRFDHAVALVRPPGHHAGRDAARGFCIFNNIAVAAAALLDEGRVGRVAILDFDVHHGNGTQDAFYSDGRVFFVSFHRWPFYPGSGAADERGEGPGGGLCVNVPLAADTPPERYLSLWRETLREKVSPFEPEVVLVSAGFDLYERDPIAGLGFAVEDFRALGESIAELAGSIAGGRTVTVLEGGYDLGGVGRCFEEYLAGLGALAGD
jgi:acetoin utilization deacetylase AcuC-like enzyme